jgi:catechol 2,3-dioxygenase-like lactoylglutathione lyase family enzyme
LPLHHELDGLIEAFGIAISALSLYLPLGFDEHAKPLFDSCDQTEGESMSSASKTTAVKSCGVHHITIQTRDWEASRRLYQDILGMQVVAEWGPEERRMKLLDVGDGSHLELIAPTATSPTVGSPTANDPLVHLALATADAAASLDLVRQAGYEVTMEPKAVTLGDLEATVAFFKGPNGEVVEFFQTLCSPK